MGFASSELLERGFAAGFISTAVRTALLAACALFLLPAAVTNAAAAPFNFASPKLLTGTVYALGSHRRKILFTFRRTAIRTNGAVRVRRRFFDANGVLAAEEDITYASGRLVSLRMREFQSDVSGAVQIRPNPKNPARRQLVISYGRGLKPSKSVTRKLKPDTVVDDTLYPFMLAHWSELMRGHAVKFRFVSLKWKRTFKFRLVRTGQIEEDGRTLELIKMTPVSFFVAYFVKPMIFDVAKVAPHHVLSYTGRVMPRVKKGNAWKYLNAETVFHWNRTN